MLHGPPADSLPDAWSSGPVLAPAADVLADAWALPTQTAAATPAADGPAALAATPPADPAPVDDDQAPQRGRFHVLQHGEVDEKAIRMTDADVVTWLTDPDDPTA